MGFYTWAVRLPGVPHTESQQILDTCWAETFRDVEVAFAETILGVDT